MMKLIFHRILAIVTIIGFVFYVIWSMVFLLKGIIPPSIMYKTTGIPSPTTGMYRSLIGIIQMDYNAYINNNPFVIPFIFLLVVTFVILISKYKNKQPLLIGNHIGLSYILIFAISEIWMLIK